MLDGYVTQSEMGPTRTFRSVETRIELTRQQKSANTLELMMNASSS
jgi:hypothetical protein